MKKQFLDQEEKEIMEAIERDEYIPVMGPELNKMADSSSGAGGVILFDISAS